MGILYLNNKNIKIFNKLNKSLIYYGLSFKKLLSTKNVIKNNKNSYKHKSIKKKNSDPTVLNVKVNIRDFKQKKKHIISRFKFPPTIYQDLDNYEYRCNKKVVKKYHLRIKKKISRVQYPIDEYDRNRPLLKFLTKTYTTYFTFKKFISCYNYYNPLIYSTKFFYDYNMHIGLSKALTHFRNGFYLLGFYLKLSIIDISKTYSQFKDSMFRFMKLSLIKFTNIFVINEIYNDFLRRGYIRIFSYFEIGFYFGRWWNGFFRNYKIFVRHVTTQYRFYKFYRNRFPGFIFFLGVLDYFGGSSLINLSYELESILMRNIMIFDVRQSIETVYNPILINLKNHYYNLFYMKMIFCILIKCFFLKKKKFIVSYLYDYKNFIKIYGSNNNFWLADFQKNYEYTDSNELLKYTFPSFGVLKYSPGLKDDFENYEKKTLNPVQHIDLVYNDFIFLLTKKNIMEKFLNKSSLYKWKI